VTIDTLPVPRVAEAERIEIDPLGPTHDGIIHVTARFEYMETPDVRRALDALEPTMPTWRKNLFIAASRLSTDGAESFCLPQDRTVIEGSRIEV
jgi:KUP system potassium uptake protein